MWVRSQDGKTLVNAQGFRITLDFPIDAQQGASVTDMHGNVLAHLDTIEDAKTILDILTQWMRDEDVDHIIINLKRIDEALKAWRECQHEETVSSGF